MIQFRLILLISFVNIFQFFIGLSESRRIVWQQRTNIGDALNWDGDKVPCSSDTVLFPQQSYELIKLSNFTTKEIILPKSGGFIMDSQMSLNFRESDKKCKRNEVRSYKSSIKTPWFSSSNWLTTLPENGNRNFINAATPHDERIPCRNDDIIFPINNSYAVDLQSIPTLMFKSIAIDGQIMTPNEFKDFLFTAHGQSLFINADNIQFIENNGNCQDSLRCLVCHERYDSVRQQLCENEKPFCQPIPHCSDPIKPIGHCCSECGALFQLKIPNNIPVSNSFNLDSHISNIVKAISTAIATSVVEENKIVYHISITTEANQLYLQLIIVDRYGYNEHSTRLMEHLRKVLLDKTYENQSKFYFLSGLPFTPNASGHVLTFIFGTFLLVTLFMTLIYIIYYDDRHIPRLMAMIRNRRFMHHSNVIFARFDNTSHANEMMTSPMSNHDHDDIDDYASGSGSMEVDLHFGTDQSIENVNRAFNNPMYDATLIIKNTDANGDGTRSDGGDGIFSKSKEINAEDENDGNVIDDKNDIREEKL